MNDELMAKVTEQMRELFVEYSMQYSTISESEKEPNLLLTKIDDLQNTQALRAASLVFHHGGWQRKLQTQLEEVLQYIKENPERSNPDAD